MAIMDDVLISLTTTVKPTLTGLFKETVEARERSGMSRGVSWAELSGRLKDGSWMELRLHHRPNDQRVQAGLLAYQPLARGGRTVVVGEISETYMIDPQEATERVAGEIATWITRLTATLS